MDSVAPIVTPPSVIDAETQAYLVSLGMDLPSLGVSAPGPVPMVSGRGDAMSACNPSRPELVERPFQASASMMGSCLTLMWKVFKLVLMVLGVLVGLALCAALTWTILVICWVLLTKIVLPLVGLLVLAFIVLHAIR